MPFVALSAIEARKTALNAFYRHAEAMEPGKPCRLAVDALSPCRKPGRIPASAASPSENEHKGKASICRFKAFVFCCAASYTCEALKTHKINFKRIVRLALILTLFFRRFCFILLSECGSLESLEASKPKKSYIFCV